MTLPPNKIRAYSSHKPDWDRFIASSITGSIPTGSAKNQPQQQQSQHPYNHQYSSFYRCRLHTLRPLILKAIPASVNVTSRIMEIREGGECVVIGTIVKDTPHPEKEVPLKVVPLRTTYCTPKDCLVLEDESGRLELNIPKDVLDVGVVTTGVVLGVKGVVQMDTGVMLVTEVYFPSVTKNIKKAMRDDHEKDTGKVMIVSGLHCGGMNNETLSLRRSLLVDYLAGFLGDEESASQITRVIIAGDICCPPNDPDDFASAAFAVKEADIFLTSLLSCGIPVDILPGSSDPTNANFPRQPLHPCLLPNACTFKGLLNRVPNPYSARLDQKLFLGTDGLNIRDFQNYTCDADSKALEGVALLEHSLRYAHIAPTAPDSLPAFPLSSGEDPFVIQELPDVYFCGNWDVFESGVVSLGEHDVKAICVPGFWCKGEVVIVDLDSLDCEVMKFEDWMEIEE